MADFGMTDLCMTDLDLLVKVAAATIALVCAVYTARQYKRTQRWRAGDLAASLIAQLESDEELAFACRALDWGVGPLIVPQRYRPLLQKAAADGTSPPAQEGTVMQHKPELMSRAVRVDLSFNANKNPDGLVYRYCFDKFFNHLANIHRHLVMEQVVLGDLEGLRYWLARIAKYEYPVPGLKPQEVFQPFLEYEPFVYRGVILLGELLDVPGWVKQWRKDGAAEQGKPAT